MLYWVNFPVIDKSMVWLYINVYLHFMSFLHIDMRYVIEILFCARWELSYSTVTIPWLRMLWLRKEPWYWLCSTELIRSPHVKGFIEYGFIFQFRRTWWSSDILQGTCILSHTLMWWNPPIRVLFRFVWSWVAKRVQSRICWFNYFNQMAKKIWLENSPVFRLWNFYWDLFWKIITMR